jgi:uncharacterized repeat protein (TIGR01451 family)
VWWQSIGPCLDSPRERWRAEFELIPLPPADPGVTLTAAPESVAAAGDNLTYTLRVGNKGPEAARRLMASFTLPPDTDFVASTPAATPQNGKLSWRLGRFGTDQQFTATITVRPHQGGPLTASAALDGAFKDPVIADNTATVTTDVQPPVLSADLALTQAAIPTPQVTAGQNLTYTVTVTKKGA